MESLDELVRSRSVAGDGGHGNVRLDGGIVPDVEHNEDSAISPQQHSVGYLGLHDRPML
jgi:hypothetical protein